MRSYHAVMIVIVGVTVITATVLICVIVGVTVITATVLICVIVGVIVIIVVFVVVVSRAVFLKKKSLLHVFQPVTLRK